MAACAAYGVTKTPTFYAEMLLPWNCKELDTTAQKPREKRTVSDDDKAVGSSDTESLSANLPPEGWTSATITEIMESWPLQIRFSSGESEFIVELSSNAEIESATEKISLGELAPGDRVEILIEKVAEQQNDRYQIGRVKKL